MDKNYEVIEFKNGEFKLDVSVTPNSDTVWLNVNQMSKLFNKNKSTILRHIKNILVEELDVREVVANVINEKKFNIPSIENITSLLEKSRKISGSLQLNGDDMLDFLLAYNKGLSILDDFDHQTMEIECSLDTIYILNYEECIQLIHETSFYNKKNLFGLEKNDSFKSAIETIYQTFEGKDLYPTLEDKAANLLYLITKNHAFTDGKPQRFPHCDRRLRRQWGGQAVAGDGGGIGDGAACGRRGVAVGLGLVDQQGIAARRYGDPVDHQRGACGDRRGGLQRAVAVILE